MRTYIKYQPGTMISICLDDCGRSTATVIDIRLDIIDGRPLISYLVDADKVSYADEHRVDGALWVTDADILY